MASLHMASHHDNDKDDKRRQGKERIVEIEVVRRMTEDEDKDDNYLKNLNYIFGKK